MKWKFLMEIKDYFSKYIMIIDEVEDSKKTYSSDKTSLHET